MNLLVSFTALACVACSSNDMQSATPGMLPNQPIGSAGTGGLGAVAGTGGGAAGTTAMAGTTGSLPTAGMTGSGMQAGSGAPPMAGAPGGGEAGMMAGDGGAMTPDDAGAPQPEPTFDDPGTGPWELVPESSVADECGLDAALLQAADSEIGASYAVVRYGKLCHENGSDSASEAYSATKTLGALVTGIASYETRDFTRTGPKTGQLSDLDRADHWLDSVSYNGDAQLAHVLAMVGHNSSLDSSRLSYSYDTVGSVQINSLSDMVNAAIAQDSARLGANIEEFTQKFLYDAIGMTGSTWSGGSSRKTYAYTWSTTLHDMARVGVLILHRGMWDGRRVLDESWTYKMTHPTFEEANTAYGFLTWLNAAAGATGPGGSFGGVGGDSCAPYAVWPSYPHGSLSGASDCLYGGTFSCEQENDAGVWSAQGLGGQFIVGHPGLDLVIVAKNSSAGPADLWAAIRPALVALDPMFMGNEEAFCTAYRAGSYAPDMPTQPQAPSE